MPTDYEYHDGTLYEVTLDEGREILGMTPVAADQDKFDKGAHSIVEAYNAGSISATNQGAIPGTRTKATEPLPTNVFVEKFVEPVVEKVLLDNPDPIPELRKIFGNDPKIIALFASTPELAGVGAKIWPSSATDAALKNRSGPDIPADSPARTVENTKQGQGEGAVPPPAPARTGVEPPLTSTSTVRDPKTGGDPVILFSGQLYYQATDLAVAGRGLSFTFVRTYLNQTIYKGPLGYGWDHSYNLWLREAQETQPDGALENVVYRSTGRVREDRYRQILSQAISTAETGDTFTDAEFDGPPGFFDRLRKVNGLYVLELQNRVRVEYSETLQATRMVDLHNNEVRLEYDSERRLVTVTDPVGKRFTFDYDDRNRIVRLRDAEGQREILYTYGDNGDLEGVDVRPDGEVSAETDYEYSGADLPFELQHNLLRIINPLGHVVLESSYGE